MKQLLWELLKIFTVAVVVLGLLFFTASQIMLAPT